MKITGNEQAYPNVSYAGLTIRQAFAMTAMQGLITTISSYVPLTEDFARVIAKESIIMSDALIAELNSNDVEVVNEYNTTRNNWWKIYPKLNSALFTHENSGRSLGELQPFSETMDGGLKPITGVSNMFTILGYTLDPPFAAPFPSVAIMFERNDDFSKIWFHYVR